MNVTERASLDLGTELLEARGAPKAAARLQAGVLVEAELKGHPSHGLQRLPRLLARIERGLADPRAEGRGHWRAEALYEVDGENGLGPVVAMAALARLDERVAASGLALAAIRNSNHLGMLAYYVEQVAAAGRIGVAISSSEALVHPFGGTRAMLGTNPIAIAVPTGARPLVVDLATSVVSMGKIHHYAATGRPIPDGWARDADGLPTTDAASASHGAIAPFGEAKGYGLGIALELLVSAIAGSPPAPEVRGTLDADSVCNKGDILLVIEPSAAPGVAAGLAAYLDAVRASPAADPACPVRIPGDDASRRRARACEDGFEIDSRLWGELNALRIRAPSHLEG
ncbi:Malate/lactate/ureidoglycolate dehydrogenase, LDH2 family [Pseudoxanthobacter soli DSM 19599]|uniref:Malate/lactate/ureidoglycolate dehydrogenase, LDH2 family n=1 Tax=Pseudoxanthobacter soli DSM 19599 TaxID=1123029 RepID=A0A1M7ZNN3_9HYPH|nr:Ldh family oxidoreductase [Pseudoxanthobacter soli]SHO66481.1 Malate/lactate/ureidoglycolate dehydrogenase, LDH2 family [Pseudoxanthobacter soli DSM 19599]